MTIILSIIIGVLLAITALLGYLLFTAIKMIGELNGKEVFRLPEFSDSAKVCHRLNDLAPQTYQNLARDIVQCALDNHPQAWSQYLKEKHFFAVTTEIGDE